MVDLANEKYVSLTTFRRDGTPVSAPVWIAPLPDGRLGVSTDPSSGKVKRARRDPRVELRPCTLRGAVAGDAPVAEGTAAIVTEPGGYREVVASLRHKYGLQMTAVEIGGRIKQLLKRNDSPDCALVITVDGGAGR